MLEKVYRKVNYVLASGEAGYWNNQRKWKEYDRTAAIVTLSKYDNRDAFCSCGLCGDGYSCGDPLCTRCCYNLRAEPAWREFQRAFATAENECFLVVLSLSRQKDEKLRLIFKDLTKSEMQQIKLSGRAELDQPEYGIAFDEAAPQAETQAYWRMFQQVMHEFTGRGKLFSGAFGGPELAVRFLPLRVLPHANYVVWSSGLSGDDLRSLRRALREKLRGSRQITPGMYPKVTVYRIMAKPDFKAVVEYIFKPIDVGCAYSVAANKVNYEKEPLVELNFQTDCFLEELPVVFEGVHRMTRFGFCSATSSNYVGVVTPERQERRMKDAERRKERQKEAAEIRKLFPEYKPHKRNLTRQQRDDQRQMRRWFRRLVNEGELPGKPPKRWFGKKKCLPP
jgi:hypothetical protein